MIKTHAGRLLYKNIYLSLYCKGSKRLCGVLLWEGAGDRTKLKYFDLKVMAVSVVSFSFYRAAQPEPWSQLCWVLAFLTTSRLPPSLTLLAWTQLSSFCSIRRPYITFKLPRGDMPLCLRWYASMPPVICHAVICLYASGDMPLCLRWYATRWYASMPLCLRNFFRYLAIEMCHFRYLWNGLCDRHRAETTVMQFRGHSLPVRQSMRV